MLQHLGSSTQIASNILYFVSTGNIIYFKLAIELIRNHFFEEQNLVYNVATVISHSKHKGLCFYLWTSYLFHLMPLLRRSSVQYMLLYIHTQQVILWFPCIRLCHISVQVFYKDQSLCTVCYQPNWKHPIIFCRLVQVQQQTGSFWIVIKSQRNSPLSISFLKTAN